MLNRYRIHATLPAADLARARTWYAEKLGLTPTAEDIGGLWYACAEGTASAVTSSGFAGTAQSTAAEWTVDDIVAVMAARRARGVVFEEYDMPGFKTENGLATVGEYKGAWFKDSEGNILALTGTPTSRKA